MTDVTAAKAVVAGIGLTATAVSTAVATAQVVLADGVLDLGEYGTIVTAVITLGASVWAVWRTPNKPKTPAQEPYNWRNDGL